MRTHTETFEYGGSPKITLLVLGDAHVGASDCNEYLLEDTRERLKEPDTYYIELGDSCEFINRHDPRFDPAHLPEWIGPREFGNLTEAQIRRYIEIMGPVAHKCLGSVAGNHEETIYRHYDRDVYTELNDRLGIPRERQLGTSGFLRLRFVRANKLRWAQVMFLHHGAGGSRKTSVTRLAELPLAFDADIYTMGHTHTKIAYKQDKICFDYRSNKAVSREMCMINTGSYKISYKDGEVGNYAEKKLLYPRNAGPVELWIYPEDKHIRLIQ